VVLWLVPLGGGLVLAALLTPAARRVATRTGDIAPPTGGRIHRRPTPLMGGLAVYLAVAIVAMVFLPLSAPVVGLLAGGLAAVVLGLVDEYRSLPPLVHLAGQIAAAVIAVAAGIGVVRHISLPTTALTHPGYQLPFIVGAIGTVFWLVLMMNTVNFLDGMDGLAAGVGALAALLLAGWALEPHPYLPFTTPHHEDIILPLALAGALLGFLLFNWNPARIFLGDSGSMFIGMALASLSIVGPTKFGTALVVMMIPVLDVAWAIVRRRMRGRNFLSGDKEHVYHRMLHLGIGYRTTVLLLYFLVLALAILDLALSKLDKLVAFVILAAVLSGAFVLLEFRASRRQAARSAESGVQPAGDGVS
jgi:UDP-GlcNAc:undecaprenyl-phosphate GlcNAc-1-phosphate transferase